MHRFSHIEEFEIEKKEYDFEKIKEKFSGFNKELDYSRESKIQDVILTEWKDGYKDIYIENPLKTWLKDSENSPVVKFKIVFYINLNTLAFNKCFKQCQIRKYGLKLEIFFDGFTDCCVCDRQDCEFGAIFYLYPNNIVDFDFAVNWYNTFLFYYNNKPTTLETLALYKMIEYKIDVPFKNTSFFRNIGEMTSKYNRYPEKYIRNIIFIKKAKSTKQILDYDAFCAIEPEKTLENTNIKLQNNYFYRRYGYVRFELYVNRDFVTTVNILRCFNRFIKINEFCMCNNRELVVINNHEKNYNNILKFINTKGLMLD